MSQVTAEQVRELVMETLNLHEEYEPEEIELDGSLFGDDGLGLDSLDALQLAVAVEEQWSVTIDESIGETVFRSLKTIADHVNANR
ncbi:MAG: acyl carrier protein [Deltaproteobacteria bacterium]|nr:acyl carrier protein [Deltaproteobacteria bacterium]